MDLAILVANPAASQFTGGLHRAVHRTLARRYQVDAVWPNSPAEATAAASRGVEQGAAMVVAMGGDGVVHHVAQGVVGTGVPLGVIPAGTTNVVAKLAGLPNRPMVVARLLTEDHELSSHPVVELSADGPRGEIRRAALFALGVGPDAMVVERAEAEPFRKYRFGGLHYARTTLSTVWSELRKLKSTATVSSDHRSSSAIGMMVQLWPAYTYFGRAPLRISPRRPDPMSVLVLREIRMRRAPSIARGALTRSGLGGVRGFELWEGLHAVELTSPTPVLAQADGELLGKVTRLSARYRAAALALVTAPT